MFREAADGRWWSPRCCRCCGSRRQRCCWPGAPVWRRSIRRRPWRWRPGCSFPRPPSSRWRRPSLPPAAEPRTLRPTMAPKRPNPPRRDLRQPPRGSRRCAAIWPATWNGCPISWPHSNAARPKRRSCGSGSRLRPPLPPPPPSACPKPRRSRSRRHRASKPSAPPRPMPPQRSIPPSNPCPSAAPRPGPKANRP